MRRRHARDKIRCKMTGFQQTRSNAFAHLPGPMRQYLDGNDTRGLGKWILAVTLLLVTTALALAIENTLGGAVSAALIYVLGITLIGATAGLTAALSSSLIAAATFNFVIADPALSFRLSKGEDIAPPVIFTLCALVSGILAGQLKDSSLQLKRFNLQLEALLESSRLLQSAADIHSIKTALEQTIPGRLALQVSIYPLTERNASEIDKYVKDPDHVAVINNAIHPTVNSDDRKNTQVLWLNGSRKPVGVMVAESSNSLSLDRSFLPTLASLVGLALERTALAEVIAEAQAVSRTEELKSALLSSVSHDLRTPLTTISASASSLLEFGSRFDRQTANELLKGIVEESDRLNRLTANLLELSRLQAGRSALNIQILAAADVVRKAIERVKTKEGARSISFAAPREEVLVGVDTVLFELALINIFQNAVNYSPPNEEILVNMHGDRDTCTITVTDQGIGIPKSEQERVFERFYRIQRNGAVVQGSGLGLAIAQGFVEAFEGKIEIMSPVVQGKGTMITIRLPRVFEGDPA